MADVCLSMNEGGSKDTYRSHFAYWPCERVCFLSLIWVSIGPTDSDVLFSGILTESVGIPFC